MDDSLFYLQRPALLHCVFCLRIRPDGNVKAGYAVFRLTDAAQITEAEVMKGEVTSPIEPPPGCRFAARCPLASERCFKESPEFKEVEPNHFVACHIYDK